MVAREHSTSSRDQEDVMPDDPLQEAVMGLWYDTSVPKPNVKVVFVQTTLVLLVDRSQHPYRIPFILFYYFIHFIVHWGGPYAGLHI